MCAAKCRLGLTRPPCAIEDQWCSSSCCSRHHSVLGREEEQIVKVVRVIVSSLL